MSETTHALLPMHGRICGDGSRNIERNDTGNWAGYGTGEKAENRPASPAKAMKKICGAYSTSEF